MLKLVLATSNEHKVEEYNAILKKHHIQVLSLQSLGLKMPNVKENGKTFLANAKIKANAVAKITRLPIIADDSGLCIKALHNFPGIHSARYAKKCKGFSNANKLLVTKLRDNRKAFFECAIAIANLKLSKNYVVSKVEGTIAKEFNNDVGFGYDPIFIPNGYDLTYNQLDKIVKNEISHRALACKKLIELLIINKLL